MAKKKGSAMGADPLAAFDGGGPVPEKQAEPRRTTSPTATPENKPKPVTRRPSKATKRKRSESSYTDGGMLRVSVYFAEAEWDALRIKAAQEATTAAALVRKAVALAYGIGKDE